MRLDADDIRSLRPVIAAVVADGLSELQQQHNRLSDRLAYSEAEAAALLGVQRHVLRDCRLRGEISARKVGREWRYQRADLQRFLDGQ